MELFPPIAIVATAFGLLLGLFFGLYAWLTKARRRTMRAIRAGAAARGWRYRLRRWQGDPTAFRIDGQTDNGITWILRSTGTRGYDRGWCVRLGLQLPSLAGKADLNILPRDSASPEPKQPNSDVLRALTGQVAKVSEVAAGSFELGQAGREFLSGLPAFDTAYQVLALPERFTQPPVDAAVADRMLHWPGDTVAPHSMLVWRDPTGLHFQARLPAPPTWTTVCYFLALAENFCLRLPAPEVLATGPTIADRLIARVLE